MTTNNLVITEMVASQYQKEVTFNDLCWLLDAVLGNGVLSRSTLVTPVAPVEGDVYIVPAAGVTGDWVGSEGKLAQFVNGSWRYYTPAEGWHVYLRDENEFVIYDGVVWGLRDSVSIGPDTDVFKQVVNINRNGIPVGWIDNSGSDVRLKAAAGSAAKLLNNSSKGFNAQSGGNHTIDVLSAAVPAGDLGNGSLSFALDETGNNLEVYVKYAAGTVKKGTVVLI